MNKCLVFFAVMSVFFASPMVYGITEYPSQSSSDSNGELYIVIFRELTEYNKEQVLSVDGVKYVQDTTFGDDARPAMLILSNQKSVALIQQFGFVYNVQPTIVVEDVMPKSVSVTSISVVLITALILLLAAIVLKRKRAAVMHKAS